VIFINSETGENELYELDLESENTKRLTNLKGDVGSPEISPDNKFILFTNKYPTIRRSGS
jgi:Tol biopolymer transport system component